MIIVDANGKPILTIKGIKGVAIPVVDEERAKHFYGEVLGLPVADGDKEPGGYRIGNAFLMLKPDWHASPSAVRIADMAYEHRISLREAAVSLKLLTAEEFDRYVKPERMTGHEDRN
jgi:catechol 2,3-dioxygenase-like lactoylglutathione lyase family enzyme